MLLASPYTNIDPKTNPIHTSGARRMPLTAAFATSFIYPDFGAGYALAAFADWIFASPSSIVLLSSSSLSDIVFIDAVSYVCHLCLFTNLELTFLAII